MAGWSNFGRDEEKARGLGVFRRWWLANVQPRTTERGDSGGGNTTTPERGAERAACRVRYRAGESTTKARAGWSGLKVGLAGWVWSGRLRSRGQGRRGEGVWVNGYRPPFPSDNPTCPPTTSRPVEGILPPSMRRMARIVPRGAPPVAFWAGVRSGGGIPNPALTHPSDNAGANPPDTGHFSASTQVKTPLRYG